MHISLQLVLLFFKYHSGILYLHSIVEHILWQNVDQRQVEMALTKTTAVGSGLDRVKIDILGYLLREIGYRSQGEYILYVHTCTFTNTCMCTREQLQTHVCAHVGIVKHTYARTACSTPEYNSCKH